MLRSVNGRKKADRGERTEKLLKSTHNAKKKDHIEMKPSQPQHTPRMSRRTFLTIAGLGGVALGAGVYVTARDLATRSPQNNRAGTRASFPQATPTGRTHEYTLEAVPTALLIGGKSLATWTYNRQLPGPEIRVKEGDRLRVTVTNRLSQDTSIHWHGVPLFNAMDGVPGATQQPIKPGERFVYDFLVPAAGTYFYHPHVGVQLDRGLYGPLIVEPTQESLSYDQEFVLVLDDWLDGMPGTPDQALQQLIAHGEQMIGSARSNMIPAYPPDIVYPRYLINGQTSDLPLELQTRKGQRLRLRLINAASATIFHVALQGHRLTVTHTDGQPVNPVTVDALRIGMGERYDVLVEANDPGIWQLAAQAEGTQQLARAVLRYAGVAGSVPSPAFVPAELSGRYLQYAMLTAAAGTFVPPNDQPDQTLPMTLGGGMGQYRWTINGQAYPQADPIALPKNSLVRFTYTNPSMMPHPMHLHGHFFQLENGTGHGPLKDTVLIDPMQRLATTWITDNPGTWAFHCHNIYHAETGMLRLLQIR
jgi:FtsP/CotA-like multicopper oxidase with cupredoxin domain